MSESHFHPIERDPMCATCGGIQIENHDVPIVESISTVRIEPSVDFMVNLVSLARTNDFYGYESLYQIVKDTIDINSVPKRLRLRIMTDHVIDPHRFFRKRVQMRGDSGLDDIPINAKNHLIAAITHNKHNAFLICGHIMKNISMTHDADILLKLIDFVEKFFNYTTESFHDFLKNIPLTTRQIIDNWDLCCSWYIEAITYYSARFINMYHHLDNINEARAYFLRFLVELYPDCFMTFVKLEDERVSKHYPVKLTFMMINRYKENLPFLPVEVCEQIFPYFMYPKRPFYDTKSDRRQKIDLKLASLETIRRHNTRFTSIPIYQWVAAGRTDVFTHDENSNVSDRVRRRIRECFNLMFMTAIEYHQYGVAKLLLETAEILLSDGQYVNGYNDISSEIKNYVVSWAGSIGTK